MKILITGVCGFVYGETFGWQPGTALEQILLEIAHPAEEHPARLDLSAAL